jgi:hypothetical protein
VDQVYGSAGCAIKVTFWVRMNSIGPKELKFGILNWAIEITQNIKFVDLDTGCAGCATN